MKKQLYHAKMDQFSTKNDSLMLNDIAIQEIAMRAGQTPFYAYDSSVIKKQVECFRQHIPNQFELHYAIKANPMPAVVKFIAPLVDGFDVSSVAEMHLALSTKTTATTISFAGPGKTANELSDAINAGITINIESLAELYRTVKEANILNIRPRIALRVNPDFELKASGMKMGGGPKPFGIDSECVLNVLKIIQQMDVDFIGLHIFSGSQNLHVDNIIEAQQKTFLLISKIANESSLPIKNVNIGGGFGIPYFPGESWLDLAPIGDNLQTLLENTHSQLSETQFVIELGRYLIGPAGIYVTQIIERKISRGKTFLITDGGLHHHLAASGNFGQVIRKNYPVNIGNRMLSSQTEYSTVVGRLCTPLDVLADNMELSKADEGDFVVIYQSGAYGLTASPNNFLSHPPPIEVLV